MATEESSRFQQFVKKRSGLPRIAGDDVEMSARLQEIIRFITTQLEVRDEIATTDPYSKKGRSSSVNEVIARGGGTPEEIALVALAMLEEAGIWVRPVLAHDRTTGAFETNMLGGADHLILLLRVDGKPWYWDPACSYCSPGMPHWRYTDDVPNAIVIDATSRTVQIPTSSSEQSREEFVERVSLSVHGEATVAGRASWSGHEDVWMRESWESLTDEGREDAFRDRLPGAIGDVQLETSDPTDLAVPLTVEYGYTLDDLPRTDDGRLLLLPPDALVASLPVPFEEQRENPIWIPFQYSVRHETTFELPDSCEISEHLPEAATIHGPGLEFTGSWRSRDEDLVWVGLLEVSTTKIAVQDYEEAVTFLSEVRRALKKGVVVRPVAIVEEERE
jgi:hypothetical protein